MQLSREPASGEMLPFLEHVTRTASRRTSLLDGDEPEPEPDPEPEPVTSPLAGWLGKVSLTKHHDTIASYVSESSQLEDLLRMRQVEQEDKEEESSNSRSENKQSLPPN